MGRVPFDGAALERLRAVSQRVEICDPEGRVVGYFEPSAYAGQPAPPEPSEEELAASEAGEEFSLGEVLDHLKTLERQ